MNLQLLYYPDRFFSNIHKSVISKKK